MPPPRASGGGYIQRIVVCMNIQLKFPLRGLAILPVFMLAAFFSGHTQTEAKGYVFADQNGNGKRDKREKALPGVAVSNGVDVVLTDEKGKYVLPVGDDNVIFVVKPAGYRAPVNGNNQPLFYYIHKPKGSPASHKFKGVAPTGELPASIDFPLIPVNSSDQFTALIFGDPQVYTVAEVGYFQKAIVDEVKGIKSASFGLSLGDLVGDTLDLQRNYIDAVGQIGIPWYNLMGNHDINYDAKTDSLSDETYESNFGPSNYSFNEGKTHFIILDNILYPNPKTGDGYTGGFREDQFRFIENDLKYVDTSRLVVLAYHIPLRGGIPQSSRVRLLNILEKFPHTLSLSAHTHMQMQHLFDESDGFSRSTPHHEYNAGTTCGDWYAGRLGEDGLPDATMRDGTPQGYAFIQFTGNKYSIEYKVAGMPADYQIEIFTPKVIPFERWVTAHIHANFFMGMKGDKVQYRFDDRPWKDMEYFENADPSYLALLYPWDTTDTLFMGRRPSNASPSRHLWRGTFPWMPEYLSLGEHTLEVKATDRYGKTYTATRKFRVDRPNP